MSSHITFLEYLYETNLQTIGGIKFTPREIDIIACITNGKSPQSIANFLSTPTKSIELQTVNTHIVNIRRKIDGNSRESIINFIEKSDRHKIIHQYYLMLLMAQEFNASLKSKIMLLLSKAEAPVISLTFVSYQNEDVLKGKILARTLQKLFSELGINSAIGEGNNVNRINNSNHYIIHVLPIQKDIETIVSNNNIFLAFPLAANSINQPNYICLQKTVDYYGVIFSILKYISPSTSNGLEHNIKSFCDRYDNVFLRHSKTHERQVELLDKFNYSNAQTPQKKSFISIIVIIFCISVFASGAIIYNKTTAHDVHAAIQSDLSLPVEFSFLNRSNLIKEIHKKFTNSANIQILAITGPGGAGKTTLAHQYASQQKANVVWVINASTSDNLKESFEQLAEAISDNEGESKQLNAIKVISDQKEREEKILVLVKKGLNKRDNWLLIFDNVENLTELGKYLPKDSYLWGNGRVIITTRDDHIKDNQYVHQTLQLGELEKNQQLTLFQKILKTKNLDVEKTKIFLESIPPYPLDISIAAHYLKSTNISYNEYLECLSNHSVEFEDIQHSLLKEIGEYEKTRYNIITMSLKRLIDTHSDFVELLLFISLINSSNIPRELLYKYKNHIIVDSFIYNLKKYSLVTSYDNSSNISLISWHKSTQSIALDYLNKTLSLEVNKKALKEIATILRLYAEELIDSEDSIKTHLLITHCEELLSHEKILTEEIKSLTEADLGIIYYNLGYNIDAEQILERAIINLEHYKDKIPYADALAYLGLVERRKGNYSKAQQLMMRSVPIYESYPERYKDLAKIFALLGNVYRPMGDYDKAKHLIEKSLKIYQAHNDYDTGYAKTLLYLGNIYRLIGEYKKATALCEEALVIHRKHPENYSGLARNLEYLGMLYNEMGLHEQALKAVTESRLNYERHYGDCNNIQCDTSDMFLGIIYDEMSEHAKAKDILIRSVASYENHYGRDHIEPAFVKFHLSRAYARLGELEKAKILLEESLLVHKKSFGEKHPKVANILHFLGYIYFKNGDLKMAEELAFESISLFGNHPSKYKPLTLLGEIYMSKNSDRVTNKAEALKNLNQALAIIEVNFPPESHHRKRMIDKIQALSLQQ